MLIPVIHRNKPATHKKLSALHKVGRGLSQLSGFTLTVLVLASCQSSPRAPLTDLELGRQIYLRRCYTCHQADGRGMMGTRQFAADLTVSPGVMDQPDAVLSRVIKTGITGPIGKMPPLGPVMSDDDISRVLKYIRTTYQAHPKKPAQP